MRRIKILLLFLCMFSVSAIAQTQNKSSRGTSSVSADASSTRDEIRNAIQDCPELAKQLSEKFGTSYNVSDEKVKQQFMQNISDKNQSSCVRKSSLKAVYGEKYADHMNKIQDK